MDPITPGQLKAFEACFIEHPQYTGILDTARKLTKQEAMGIIEMFHGTSYSAMRAVSEERREYAKQRIPKALTMLEEKGFVPMCYLCRQPRIKCVC